MKHRVLFIITALCFLASCSKGSNTEVSPSDQTVKIKLFVQESGTTKSLPQVSEALLADLNLFVYDGKGALTTHRYVDHPDTEVTIEINKYSDYTIYAIANSGNLSGRNEVYSINSIQNMVWEMTSPEDLAGPDGSIPMSGKLFLDTVEGGTTLTLYLTRLFSKFRVIVDTTGLDNDVTTFDITRVRIRNMNRRVGYFTASGAFSSSDIFDIGLSAEGNELKRLYTHGLDFYVPENIQGDLLSGNGSEQGHIPPSSHSGLCTYIEFTVRYRSSEHYNDNLIYRYYLHDGNNLDNFDVVRNTMYTCRTVFQGSGLDDNSWRVDVSGMKDLVTSITVTPHEVTFYEIGEMTELTATVLPSSAENPDVRWESDNENVATVTQSGIVQAVGDGKCTITACATDGSGISGSSTINVLSEERYFFLNNVPDVLYPNYNCPMRIRYSIFPLASPTFRIECLSGKENGATVFRDRLMGLNPDKIQGEIGRYLLIGEAIGLNVQKEFSVNAGEVEINRLYSNLYLGIPSRLSFNSLIPADVKLSWSISDPEMAVIDENGTITPQKTGRCTIMAESVTGASDEIEVNILEPYLSFIDVTMFEGAVWELSSGLRPITADLPVEYSVVKGEEYVSISGNRMTALKRTDGFNDVIIEARLVDFPQISATANVHVVPAVSASLEGDNRVVNTYGLSSDGSSWSNFRNSLQLDVIHAPNVTMTWEVRDSNGNISDDVTVSEDGTVNPYSAKGNGTYTIVGWDHLHRFCTDEIEIEVYRLIEYECGLGGYSIGIRNGRNVYSVTLTARWSNDSWNVIVNNSYAYYMLQQNLITYPESGRTYHTIGSSSSSTTYIQNYLTDINYYSTQNVISALNPLRPLSYLRVDLSDNADNTAGINGVFFKFTAEQNNGLDGYFYIKQRNEIFYNSNEYL